MRAHPKNQADVIVIGGGFAGLIAARELRHAGRSAIVLEARDRLGGRVWTQERLGFRVELGGTWVHWQQPHVWAELTRYGVTVVPSPSPSTIGWAPGDGVEWMEPDEFFARLDPGQRASISDAREVFPLPFEPFSSAERLTELDGASIADRLRALGMPEREYVLNHTMWSMHFNAPCDEGGLTQALRWAALAGWDWQRLLEVCATFKLVGGMSGLIDMIAADARADIRLATPVATIEHDDDGVVVHAEGGAEFRGAAAIVTVPINTLTDIAFDPPLGHVIGTLARQGQVSRGFKLWMRVRGKLDPMIAVAAPPHPLTLIQAEYWDEHATGVVAFGLEAEALEVNDVRAVQAALRVWLPDAEVESCTGHEWTTDPYSKGTWAMLRPGQLEYVQALQDPIGRLVLAGSDYATGWAGFVDGAIQSAIVAANKANRLITYTPARAGSLLA